MEIVTDYIDQIFYKSSEYMEELPDESVNLIVTSPPYFNIKDYSKDGYQKNVISNKQKGQIGDIDDYVMFINNMIPIWRECFRVLKPNGKIIINTPLMPMVKTDYSTHYNRDIFNINSSIENSILSNIKGFYLLDLYIWNRTNSSKNLMFGSYPFPRNFYAQNTIEFINVFVKAGGPQDEVSKSVKRKSRLTQQEWTEYTKQVWNLSIPNKKDTSYGKHSAIMPEEIVKRCIRLYSFVEDLVLDPFAGSGTTLKVAKELNRYYVGYEISEEYKDIIKDKINSISLTLDMFENDWGDEEEENKIKENYKEKGIKIFKESEWEIKK